jgi:hypothetical protein
MPYAPNVSYHGDQYAFQGITSAGNSLAGGITDAVKKLKEQETTDSYNDAIMQHALQNGLVGVDDYTKFKSGSKQQRTGMAAAVAANIHQDLQQAQINKANDLTAAQTNLLWAKGNQMWSGGSENGMPFSPPKEIIDRGRAMGMEWLPTGPSQGVWREDPNNPANMGGNKDSWVKLNKDVKNLSGVGLGDWQRAENKRLDPQTGEFVAELPAGNSTAFDGVTYGGTRKTLRVPGTTYQQLLGRFQDLSGSQPNAMPIRDLPQPATSPDPSPAATPVTVPQVGEVRRGFRFKGGDPANKNDWEKVE